MINAQNHHSIEAMEIFHQSQWKMAKTGESFCSPSTQRRDFPQENSKSQPRSDQPNILALRRSDNRPTTGFASCEQKFLQNDQASSNVVRFTITDETIIEVSDYRLLNC